MRALALVPALALAGAAGAEQPLFSLTFGADSLAASSADVLGAEAVFDQSGQRALQVRLDPRLSAQIAALTAAHVGEVGALRICGEVKSEPRLVSEIATTTFLIAGLAAAETDRLAAALTLGRCEPTAES